MSGSGAGDLGAAGDRGLEADVDRRPAEHAAAAVDGIRLAVTGVDAIVPVAAGEDVLPRAAGDLVVPLPPVSCPAKRPPTRTSSNCEPITDSTVLRI